MDHRGVQICEERQLLLYLGAGSEYKSRIKMKSTYSIKSEWGTLRHHIDERCGVNKSVNTYV